MKRLRLSALITEKPRGEVCWASLGVLLVGT